MTTANNATKQTSAGGRAETWFDATNWPLLLIALPQTQTDLDVERYLQLLAEYRNRKQPYGIVLNTDRSMGFTARQRRMQADHIRDGLEQSRIYLKAIAFVASASWRRGMLTAVFWLQPPPSAYEVFSTQHAAREWVKSRVDLAYR